MNNQIILALIVLFPLIGALLNAFVLRKTSVVVVCLTATLAVAIPFILSLILFFGSITAGTPVITELFDWISVPLINGKEFNISFALTADRLSGLFLLVITGVGTLIHLYSGEYMHHEKNPYRFFVYLNLFIVSMLLLVLGSNMLVTFLGWEGVGVCSYLLIGYWYEDTANSMAAIKAFIANRVGDAGFLIAMFFCYMLFKTINYSELASVIAATPQTFFIDHSIEITLIGLCLLLGVAGKSAQIPLYTWLPDAMAGPTPVSALIHAATMVTSGIYLMNRMSFVLVLSPTVMTTIAIIGAATAILSATIGFAQTDIKKVLAYSTCSQLGYMVLACGVGAFQYGVSHVITHAFFKACLFLGAGSVIHAMHHEQDIRKMGGLFKKMPITSITFIIATLAIIGFPGFSGFFSKDAILAAAWSGPFGNPILWFVGWITAGFTAFYMLRLTWLVFFGQSRAEHPEHIHETNFVITIPLIILAVFSALGGLIAIPEVFTGHEDFITRFLSPVLLQAQDILKSSGIHTNHLSHSMEFGLMAASVAIVFVGAIFAVTVYKNGPQGGERFANAFGGFYRLVRDKWRVDKLYNLIIYQPLAHFGKFLFRIIDRKVIDGVVNGIPETLYTGTSVASDAQSGMARNYLKFIYVGVFVFGLILFL
ncbi:NADH-quinone oxidoreductase subunit L [Fluviispira multicolorata]|uniref:NADH-quinone oxidoreductase subunit L n=1 Tax=Fluviispira multicolorata TaxID=2654512 RepID=A0A833JDF4_9BACT|nr:NADH-quinone oxidoreductase subunit L [Fluviispira multicolorata]KAB8028446.1 NADH-quinone oxidoreductase subunit L [Fluviispira multicolorata]